MNFNKEKIQSLVNNLQLCLAEDAGEERVLPIIKMLMEELQPLQNDEIKNNFSAVMPATADNKNIFPDSNNFSRQEQFNACDSTGVLQEALTIIHDNSAGNSDDIKLNNYYQLSENNFAQMLQSATVKDLTRDVNNDERYLFISKLFRSDEEMYNRCLLTLNSFDSYRQAHNWAERELHLKLGWDSNNTVVQEFDQLIKMRYEAA